MYIAQLAGGLCTMYMEAVMHNRKLVGTKCALSSLSCQQKCAINSFLLFQYLVSIQIWILEANIFGASWCVNNVAKKKLNEVKILSQISTPTITHTVCLVSTQFIHKCLSKWTGSSLTFGTQYADPLSCQVDMNWNRLNKSAAVSLNRQMVFWISTAHQYGRILKFIRRIWYNCQ